MYEGGHRYAEIWGSFPGITPPPPHQTPTSTSRSTSPAGTSEGGLRWDRGLTVCTHHPHAAVGCQGALTFSDCCFGLRTNTRIPTATGDNNSTLFHQTRLCDLDGLGQTDNPTQHLSLIPLSPSLPPCNARTCLSEMSWFCKFISCYDLICT